jgi:hypothetical protein
LAEIDQHELEQCRVIAINFGHQFFDGVIEFKTFNIYNQAMWIG